MPKRWNTKSANGSPEALAARLPAELKTFDAWYYTDNGKPTGIQGYLAVLGAFVGESPSHPSDVMNAAGLSVAQWFKTMMSK
jgi:hypothetical protein